MTDRRDNAPPPEGWKLTPRCCPFESCDVCDPGSQIASGFGTYPSIPPTIELGEN